MYEVCRQYDRIAEAYDRARSKGLMERPYLERLVSGIPDGGDVLDLGCGAAEPIAAFLIDNGYRVTGVDGAHEMIRLCRARFPEATWIEADMREMGPGPRFDAVIAWDSFFHLDRGSQRRMFPRFRDLLRPGGVLLYTSGHEEGEIVNTMLGEAIFHASLDETEYRRLLADSGFEVLDYRKKDEQCGNHTVWLARRSRD